MIVPTPPRHSPLSVNSWIGAPAWHSTYRNGGSLAALLSVPTGPDDRRPTRSMSPKVTGRHVRLVFGRRPLSGFQALARFLPVDVAPHRPSLNLRSGRPGRRSPEFPSSRTRCSIWASATGVVSQVRAWMWLCQPARFCSMTRAAAAAKAGMPQARRFSAKGSPQERASLRLVSTCSRASASETKTVLPNPSSRRAIDAPPQARSTSNAVTLRVSLLNSTPIMWMRSPDARYLSA